MFARNACLFCFFGLGVAGCAAPHAAPDLDAAVADAGSSHDAGLLDGGAAAPDGGTQADGGAAPIVAPPGQWTWVDFPDSRCASGAPTGLAVNPQAGATALLIYLEGGGQCTNATECWGPSPTATNLGGYDSTTFASAAQLKYPALDRNAAGNPFAAMNMVYVPYCTGDLHAGNRLVDFDLPDGGVQPTYFYGAPDLDVFLARLVPTFSPVSRVWLLGTSAGGFGAFLEFDRVASAFGARVDLVDDSGPPLVAKGGADNAALFAVWALSAPTGCSGCNSFAKILQYDLSVQSMWATSGEFAFLSFTEDTVISQRFGYSLAEYPGLMQTFSTGLPASPAAATFLVGNDQSHVVESNLTLATQYFPWMTEMVNRNPAWGDATYAVP